MCEIVCAGEGAEHLPRVGQSFHVSNPIALFGSSRYLRLRHRGRVEQSGHRTRSSLGQRLHKSRGKGVPVIFPCYRRAIPARHNGMERQPRRFVRFNGPRLQQRHAEVNTSELFQRGDENAQNVMIHLIGTLEERYCKALNAVVFSRSQLHALMSASLISLHRWTATLIA